MHLRSVNGLSLFITLIAARAIVNEETPTFFHYSANYRINFDGTGLTAFTEGDGTHTVSFSPDGQY